VSVPYPHACWACPLFGMALTREGTPVVNTPLEQERSPDMDGTPGTAHADQPTAGTTEPTADIREEAAADARAVVETAEDQTRGAMTNMKQEFRRQMSEQKSHVAGSIREIGDELEKASGSSSGTVADMASTAAQNARRISAWVEDHEPG